MNARTPSSWFDFPEMPTQDPRSIIQTLIFEDQAGVAQTAAFSRSATWLQSVTWVDAPMIVTPYATATPHIIVPNVADFDSVNVMALWNSSHAMTATSARLPKAVEKIMFLKAGQAFVNFIYLDWAGATSTDVQFSFRDNSVTSGDFQNSALGTIPAFVFPTSTYGGTARALQVTLLRPGRFTVGLRILDNSGNYSLYEMDWYVMP